VPNQLQIDTQPGDEDDAVDKEDGEYWKRIREQSSQDFLAAEGRTQEVLVVSSDNLASSSSDDDDEKKKTTDKANIEGPPTSPLHLSPPTSELDKVRNISSNLFHPT
jgi:hypothetical protein